MVTSFLSSKAESNYCYIVHCFMENVQTLLCEMQGQTHQAAASLETIQVLKSLQTIQVLKCIICKYN